MDKEYIPYCYLIGWKKLNKWYYGSEYGKINKIANPENLWKSYFTSSEYVHRFVKENGQPDIIKIRKTFMDSDSCRLWEQKVLIRLNVIHKDEWLNETNNISISPRAISKVWKGKNLPKEHKKKVSDGMKKVWADPLYRLMVRDTYAKRPGKPRSEETRKKISESRKGKKYPNQAKAIIGRKLSDEHIKKLRIARIGNTNAHDAAEKRKLAR